MKKFYSTLIATIAALLSVAQSTGDCEGAIVLCNDLYTEETAPPGAGNIFEYTGLCNQFNESTSLWYTFTVQQDGNLSFIITPANDADDYDWGLFDITTGGCAGITENGPSPEVSCNSYGTLSGSNGPTGISTAEGGTGNSNGPGDLNGPAFNADLPVTQGQTFALVVMNWSQSQDGYTIDFSGSTATIYDDINPSLESITANCGNNEFHIVFSENIINSTAESLDFSITGPGGTFIITDVVADNPSAEMDSGFNLTLDVSITEPGIYTLNVSNESGNVEDACGNLAIDESIEIELFSPITYTSSVTTACNGVGGSISITEITGGDAPYSIEVNNQSVDDNVAENLDNGTYNVEITDNNNCVVITQIEVPDNPISVTVPAQDTLSCARSLVDVSGVEITPEQNVEFVWYFEENGNFNPIGSTSSTPALGDAGLYMVEVTNPDNGCSASTTLMIYAQDVEKIDLSKMKFPNVITPNKDSKNEDWSPFIEGDENLNLASIFEEFDLKIFNRWGQVVFDTTKGNSRRWTVNEEEAGNYYYILKYKITCGGLQEGTREGFIQLLR